MRRIIRVHDMHPHGGRVESGAALIASLPDSERT